MKYIKYIITVSIALLVFGCATQGAKGSDAPGYSGSSYTPLIQPLPADAYDKPQVIARVSQPAYQFQAKATITPAYTTRKQKRQEFFARLKAKHRARVARRRG